jgi:translation initiation factor IF-2
MTQRIHELAKELNVSSTAMLKIVHDLGFTPKSHMSVASDDMIVAVRNKFAAQKQEAKKEMEQRAHVKEAVDRTAAAAAAASGAPLTPSASGVATTDAVRISGFRVADGKGSVAGLMREIEKKQKKKERRKKKDRRTVDQAAVAKSFKTTMATLGTGKAKRKYHRDDEGGEGADAEPTNVIEATEFMTLAELAKTMDQRPAALISKLFEMGSMATINQRLDMDTIETLASEFGFSVAQIAEVGEDAREEEREGNLETRAPVVTIMGHVDHGKTSLLDFIRKTNVVAGEAGAITQHIGAYQVVHGDRRITFLDTPGHEAFTAMRARGAQVTDIVILVVAADDGVRPQTVEAIDHARAADVPIIVAINKIDKPTANPDIVRTQLTNHRVIAEEWGGNTIMAEVSAKTGAGIDKLLDMILLQADIMDLKADAGIRAQGVVIESRLEKGRGPVATVLIQKGNCCVGDSIVAGVHFGRIRTLTTDRDVRIDEAGPSTPVQITGLDGVPGAGETFMSVTSDQEAKEITLRRSQIKREHDSRRIHSHVSLDKVFERIKEGQIKELRLVIKGDVDGSVQVLADTLTKIATDEVKPTIIHGGVGAVTESDVLLATASDAIIIGFHVSIDPRARELAKQEKVDIRLYDIIYEAETDVKNALSGMLSPTLSERFVGMVEVRNIFRVPKVGVVAGCYVKQGRVTRKDKVRVVRDGKVIYIGSLNSLKRFKDDAREVKEGFECGAGIENYNDIKVGDMLELFEVVEEARSL